ncbi:MAG TPA: polysaccharide biosynthesis protein [Clostridiaceae bacterium]|nr:polysaccharide biosynthesis protein [Clostridiaceae bacterium]
MRQKAKSFFLVIIDIFLINISLILAYWLRFDGILYNIPARYADNILYLAILSTLIKILCFMVFKLYSSLWKYAGVSELISVAAATFFSNIIMECLVLSTYSFLPEYLGRYFSIIGKFNAPRSIFLIAFLIDVLFIGGVRLSYRIARRIVKGETAKMKNPKRVLIVGGGDAGAIAIKELIMHPEMASIPVAIIDDNVEKLGKKLNGVPVVGTREDIPRVVEKKRIDEIIMAIPSADRKNISDIFDICSKTGRKVKILPSVTELIDEQVVVQRIRDVNIEDLLGREPIKLDCHEISTYIEGRVILVTGGGGSIGSELCRQIAGFKPKQLIILDNYENSLYEIQNELLFSRKNINLVPVVANIREKQRLEGIFRKYRPDVVFHAAAHKHVPLMEVNPSEAIKNNVFGTLNVAECADKYGVKRFVLISTDKAVNPTNIMGASKRIAEMIIQALNRYSKTEFVAVRFGNVLGSNGSVIPLFKKQIENGGPVTVTHPEVIRYFMTIPEAVQLVLQAGAMANGGEIFVLDMGQPVKIYDLAKNLIRLSGFEPEKDIEIVFTGLRPGEKLYEELLLAEEGLMATKNNKIYVAQPVFTDLALLRKQIARLKDIIFSDEYEGISEYVQDMVPTYNKAQNI